MGKAKEFENILDECLDQLIKGETIESCLARYPQYAAALEPLLKTAQETRVAAAVKPRPEFRQRAAGEFQEAVRNLPVKKGGSAFKWQLRWALPVAVVLILLAGGSGTVVAASNSLPDSPLYQVKLATESVQMAFTFSEQSKAELYARFVDYRVEEIVKMAEDGNTQQVEQATERMNGHLLAMADLKFTGAAQEVKSSSFGIMAGSEDAQVPSVAAAPPAPTTAPTTTLTQTQRAEVNGASNDNALSDIEKLKLLLMEKLEKNLQILRDQLEKAPEALKPALQKAIQVAEEGYWLTINNLG